MRKRKKVKKVIRMGAIGLLLVIIVAMLVVFQQSDRATGGTEIEDTQAYVSSTEEEPAEQLVRLGDTMYRLTDDIETLLFLGTDQSGNEATEDEAYHGAMADMVMVLVVNHTTQEYSLLQLNRDTMATVYMIDSDGSGGASKVMQLCTAHWYGGDEEMNCSNMARSVSELLGGIPVSTYYCLTWEGITTLNTVVDGVTLTIQNDFSQVDPSMVMGETITLTDEQAYTFLRGRMNVDDGENLSRMDRHRQYLSAWLQKVKELSAEDSAFPAKVYQDLSPYAFTNLKGNQFSSSIQRIMSYSYNGIVTIDGETTLGQALGDGIDHTEFYMYAESKYDTITQLFDLEATDYDAEPYELWDYESWDEITAEVAGEDDDSDDDDDYLSIEYFGDDEDDEE